MTKDAAVARATAFAARSVSIAAPDDMSDDIVGFEAPETPSNPSSTCTTLATA